MNIRYAMGVEGITPGMLTGFFQSWKRPLSPEAHLHVLKGSRHVILAIDDEAARVVGFINALGDGVQSAFIPLLEVLPEYRRKGIGRDLVKRALDLLRDYPCIDLTCDPALQPFYEKSGMQRSVGMVIRDNARRPFLNPEF